MYIYQLVNKIVYAHKQILKLLILMPANINMYWFGDTQVSKCDCFHNLPLVTQYKRNAHILCQVVYG